EVIMNEKIKEALCMIESITSNFPTFGAMMISCLVHKELTVQTIDDIKAALNSTLGHKPDKCAKLIEHLDTIRSFCITDPESTRECVKEYAANLMQRQAIRDYAGYSR